jgi:hypothetical protein
VELELDFFQPVGDVFVVDAFYKNAPLVGVVDGGVGGSLFGVKGLRFAAEDEWAEDGDGLEMGSLLVWVCESGTARMETDFDALITCCRRHDDSLEMCAANLEGESRRAEDSPNGAAWKKEEQCT